MCKSTTGQPLWRIGEAGEGGTLFASVFREMGHLRVGVLMFREQEGAWAATRHGVTLTLEQFHTLVHENKVWPRGSAFNTPLQVVNTVLVRTGFRSSLHAAVIICMKVPVSGSHLLCCS